LRALRHFPFWIGDAQGRRLQLGRVLYYGSPKDACSLMGHRLSKIYTRTGDGGETGLGDGSRTRKDSPRVVVLGEIDELNSAIGVLLAEPIPEKIRAVLEGIQHDLFDLGGDVSIPGRATMTAGQVQRLEALLDQFNSALPRLKEFILPGGTRTAGLAHLARAVCRRAERSIVALSSSEKVADPARVYLNRLSDLLFVLGRALNREGGRGDVLWQQGKNR
jgi:cob(I)alamin adenosyltransferase